MNPKRNEVLITGIGLVSPFGSCLDEFFQAQINNRDCITNVDIFKSDKFINPRGIYMNKGYTSITPEDRIISIGRQAIKKSLLDWGGTINRKMKVGLIVGSGLGLSDHLHEDYGTSFEPKYLSSLAEKLAIEVDINCEAIYIGNACSAGSQAIGYGMDLIEADYLDIVIAGGIDIMSELAYAGFLRLNAIDADGCKPFDKKRKGIMVGEGAAFCIMEKADNCSSGRKVYGHLAGIGNTNDAYHIVQMKQGGEAIKHAMDMALKEANTEKKDIDLIIAHGTGTILNDKTESMVVADYFRDNIKNIIMTAPKGALGHTGGASGAFGVLMAVCCIKEQLVPQIYNLTEIDEDCSVPMADKSIKKEIGAVLINTFAFGGTNTVIILKKWIEG